MKFGENEEEKKEKSDRVGPVVPHAPDICNNMMETKPDVLIKGLVVGKPVEACSN